MDAALQSVLTRLHARMERERALELRTSDADFSARIDEFMLAIGEDAGRLTNLLAKAARSRAILELGTSVGYSTLWLADAARATGGRVVSVDANPDKHAQARENLRDGGLADRVELVTDDVLAVIAAQQGPLDFVLLDAWKDVYEPCFLALHPRLPAGALIVADNMTFPDSPGARAYQQRVRATPGWQSVLLPIGNGLELSRNAGDGATEWPGAHLRPVLSGLHARMAEEDTLRETLSAADFAARRADLMLAVGEETGRLLHLLVLLSGARRVLEVGTSVGYSTLWLADALRQTGGRITSVDASADKQRQARENLEQAGLLAHAELVQGSAPDVLARLAPPFDLVLLDCERHDYVACLEALLPRLEPGALIVADNMTFPASPHAGEYQARIRGATGWQSVLVPIGNGVELSRRDD